MNFNKKQINTSSKWLNVIFMACFCMGFTAQTSAQQQWQAHSELEAAAEVFLQKHFKDQYKLELKFGKLDRRLRLAKCQQNLSVFLPSNREPVGSVSMGIRCAQPKWKVHYPVKVKAFANVLVATRPIPRNSIIAKSDLGFVTRDVSRYSAGVFTELEHLTGMVAKRSIRHDAVITTKMVKAKRLVRRGDVISIIAEANGLRIHTKGEALMDGHHGQIIQVKNKRSGRQVSAEVIAQSTVRVKM